MVWFNRAVHQGVEKALTEFCAPGGELSRMVDEAVWKNMDSSLRRGVPLTSLGFLWGLKLKFRSHVASNDEASAVARETFESYLKDEGIKFGDPDYDWTREGAETVAEECELQYWESVA